jgi:hypothetical protein
MTSLEPRTAAGRALLAGHEPGGENWQVRRPDMLRAILAIEAEAASPDSEALRAALGTALSVALHEQADPQCTGEPPYDVTQAQAASLIEEIWRAPIVRAALTPEAKDD